MLEVFSVIASFCLISYMGSILIKDNQRKQSLLKSKKRKER